MKIREVAALVDVSVTTVSHVLNEVEGRRISLDTRRKVQKAAEQVGSFSEPVEGLGSGARG